MCVGGGGGGGGGARAYVRACVSACVIALFFFLSHFQVLFFSFLPFFSLSSVLSFFLFITHFVILIDEKVVVLIRTCQSHKCALNGITNQLGSNLVTVVHCSIATLVSLMAYLLV